MIIPVKIGDLTVRPRERAAQTGKLYWRADMTQLLMPMATAVWLVDNTTLTFDQIAAFCSLHPLEVQGIADGDVATGIKGADPIANGQLERGDIERCEADESGRLVLKKSQIVLPEEKRKGPRYTPISKRQDRPDGINWLVRYHPELTDAQICRLLGTTKTTVQAVRNRTHWNSTNLQLKDPVSMGLCTQIELDAIVTKAAGKKAREDAKLARGTGQTVLPTSETLAEEPAPEPMVEEPSLKTDISDPDALFNLPKSGKQ